MPTHVNGRLIKVTRLMAKVRGGRVRKDIGTATSRGKLKKGEKFAPSRNSSRRTHSHSALRSAPRGEIQKGECRIELIGSEGKF